LKTLSTDKKINLIYFKIKNIFKKYLKAALELEAMLNTPQKRLPCILKQGIVMPNTKKLLYKRKIFRVQLYN
jgi:hypothetical protein